MGTVAGRIGADRWISGSGPWSLIGTIIMLWIAVWITKSFELRDATGRDRVRTHAIFLSPENSYSITHDTGPTAILRKRRFGDGPKRVALLLPGRIPAILEGNIKPPDYNFTQRGTVIGSVQQIQEQKDVLMQIQTHDAYLEPIVISAAMAISMWGISGRFDSSSNSAEINGSTTPRESASTERSNHRVKQPAKPVTALAMHCGGPDSGPSSARVAPGHPAA